MNHPDGTYYVIVQNGRQTWKPVTARKRKQPGPLASIWRDDAPADFEHFVSELRRYGYLSGQNLRMTSTQALAMFHVLAPEYIPAMSLRRFHMALRKTFKVGFSVRAMQGAKKWERYFRDFENILLSYPSYFQNTNPQGIQRKADSPTFDKVS